MPTKRPSDMNSVVESGFQAMGGSSEGQLERLAKIHLVDADNPTMVSMQLANIDREAVPAYVILRNTHYKSAKTPEHVELGSLEHHLFTTTAGDRIATLAAIISRSIDGQGATQMVDILKSVGRMFGRHRGMMGAYEQQDGLGT